jgi:MoxR-like ATPase
MDEMHDNQDPIWWVYRGLSEEALAKATGLAPAGFQDREPLSGLADAAQRGLSVASTPPWRRFERAVRDAQLGADYQLAPRAKDLVSAALLLRRPLLVTGTPGSGKTALAHSLARELGLGPVLPWPITSRTELKHGLYDYDAIARLQDTQRYFQSLSAGGDVAGLTDAPRWMGRGLARRRRIQAAPRIEQYLKLGPLGTALALPRYRAVEGQETPEPFPRVLLIDEIDKCDIDLPNDLLHVFEEGEFEIDELRRDQATRHRLRTHDDKTVDIEGGKVKCQVFPIVVMTSNSEREFPGPFRRRCIELDLGKPNRQQLTRIVRGKVRPANERSYDEARDMIEKVIIPAFAKKVREGESILAIDQLMQLVYLVMQGVKQLDTDFKPYRDQADAAPADEAQADDEGTLLVDALWRSLREG